MDDQQNAQPMQSSTRPFDQNWVDPWALERWERLEASLVAAGAYPAEIAETKDAWLHNQNWPHHAKERLYALGDAKLREEIVAMRQANRTGMETEAEEKLRETAEQSAADDASLRFRAEQMSAYDCDSILDYVGHDLRRARMQLFVEHQHPQPRADVLAALIDRIDRLIPSRETA